MTAAGDVDDATRAALAFVIARGQLVGTVHTEIVGHLLASDVLAGLLRAAAARALRDAAEAWAPFPAGRVKVADVTAWLHAEAAHLAAGPCSACAADAGGVDTEVSA